MLEAIIFTLFFEVSYMPSGNLNLYEGYKESTSYITADDPSVNIKTGINITAFDILNIGGEVQVNAIPLDYDYIIPAFSPQSLGSWFWAYIELEIFQVGLKHYCLHPVLPYFDSIGNFKQNYEGSFTEVFVRVEISTK